MQFDFTWKSVRFHSGLVPRDVSGTCFPLGTLSTYPGPRDRWGLLAPARSPTVNRYLLPLKSKDNR